MRADTRDVIIAGGGPTGVMLARELRLQGMDVLVLERDGQPTTVVRAGGLQLGNFGPARSGRAVPGIRPQISPRRIFDGILKDSPEGVDTTYPYVLVIPHLVSERLLTESALAAGVELRRGQEVASVSQDDDGVMVGLKNGGQFRARYLVGCEGAAARFGNCWASASR